MHGAPARSALQLACARETQPCLQAEARTVSESAGGGLHITRSMQPSSSAVGTYLGPSADTGTHSVTALRLRGEDTAVLLRNHCQVQADASVNCTVARASRGYPTRALPCTSTCGQRVE